MPCGIHRVFLDTNVVQALEWLGEYIWYGDDAVLSSAKFATAGEEAQKDYLAMRWMFGSPRGQPFEVVVSQRSIVEFAATPHASRRASLISHGTGLYDWSREVDTHATPSDSEVNLALGLRQSLLLTLPDEIDRQLVAEAVMRDCDTFLTIDRRTIRKHEEVLERVALWTGLRTLRPSEAWELIKPWAGLIW